MAQQGGREVTTPVVMGEQLDPPKYGESWSEAASRVFFAAYREYEQRVKFANAEGVVRRQLMGVSQLIPVYVQRCFAQHYYQRQILTAEELLNALKQHAGYNTAVGQMVRERAATEIRRVAKMQPGGGTVKDRVMHVSSALEKYFCDNPEVDALYRASNGEYLPGPAESVSIALVDGISPADFRNRVRTELTYVEGWKKQPNAVLRRMIDQAEAWKIVEAHGSSMAEVVEPFRVFLKQLMAGASRRTKRVARNRVIQEDAWTAERVRAWRAAQDLVAQAVPLYHPRPGCVVLMFPDASDFHWGSFLTQVPEEEFRSGVALENMSHEPLAFLSGSFKGSQLRWATVDKEGFAIVNTFRRLEYRISFPSSQPRLAQPRLRLSTCSIGARLWGCRVCG